MSQRDTRTTSVDVDIDDERTLLVLSGTRAAAVVVYSESGERVYLPPEEAVESQDEDGDESDPYHPGGADSPYGGEMREEGPYGATRTSDPEVGLTATADGFQINHPEPVHDFRVLT